MKLLFTTDINRPQLFPLVNANPPVNEEHTRYVAYAAGILVLVSAVVHLAVGAIELYEALVLGEGQIALGIFYFVATVLAVMLVGAYATEQIKPTPAYALGAGLMVLYIIAYADWHVLGYAETYLPLDVVGLEHDHGHHGHDHNGHDHNGHNHDSHDDTALESLLSHIRDDPFALVSKSAEIVAGALLALLAVVTRK